MNALRHFLKTCILKHGYQTTFDVFVCIVNRAGMFMGTFFQTKHTDFVVEFPIDGSYNVLQPDPVHFFLIDFKPSHSAFHRINNTTFYKHL